MAGSRRVGRGFVARPCLCGPSPGCGTVGRVWKPRLIALDIDGTLVDFDGVFFPGTREAVADAVAAGVPVVLATGRGWAATQEVFDALGLPPGPAVTSNGAVLVTYPPLRIHDVVTFDPSAVIELVASEHPRALLAVEVIGEGYRVNRPFPPGELGGRVEVVGLDDLGATPVSRLVVRDPDASDEEFLDLAERMGLEGVSYSIGYTAWLDIAPEGVDKTRGLALVAERLGVAAADVLAVGDGRNDLEMLRWAGRGVAMGDAPDEVRAVADAVTDPVAQGGLVRELRRWFPVVRAAAGA